MRFLYASALWWVLLAAPIIFFYLLKLKRKRVNVPSVLLWQRALQEIEANAPFRRLRRSLLLLLQLAALGALVFALAHPVVATRSISTGNTIIVLDSTASMRAHDQNGGTRLERARELAHELVDGLGRGARAAIIESSARVTLRSPLTSDRNALGQAIDAIQETDSAGALDDALRLSEEIAKAERDSGIVVISDGAGRAASDSSLRAPTVPSTSLRFVRVGSRANNVGIIAMNTRTIPGSPRQEVFASVGNFSDEAREIGVELRIDGKLVDARTTRPPANGRDVLIYDSVPSGPALAELRLEVDDDLDSDDVAYVWLPDTRKVRVGLVSDNRFLSRALAANPALNLRRIALSDAASPDLDCIVTEGPLTTGIVESNRPLLAINPPDFTGLWRNIGTRDGPEVTFIDRDHPINDYLNYADLHIEAVPRRDVAPWLKPVVGSASGPLIWAGDDGQRRIVMVGFDLAQTDLPIKVEFPILLANSVSWLGSRDAAEDKHVVRAGQPVTLRTRAPYATIVNPQGETLEARATDGSAVFAETLRNGVYTVKDGPPFAVTLLTETESDTTPRDSLTSVESRVSAGSENSGAEREAWRWIALAALAILCFEWWVYHKRIAS